MKSRNLIILGISFFFILFASGFFFVVDQTKQVIVLQFGEPRAVHQTPGLKFKLPFIDPVWFTSNKKGARVFKNLTYYQIDNSKRNLIKLIFSALI